MQLIIVKGKQYHIAFSFGIYHYFTGSDKTPTCKTAEMSKKSTTTKATITTPDKNATTKQSSETDKGTTSKNSTPGKSATNKQSGSSSEKVKSSAATASSSTAGKSSSKSSSHSKPKVLHPLNLNDFLCTPQEKHENIFELKINVYL